MEPEAWIYPYPEACRHNIPLARLIGGWLTQLGKLLASKEGRVDKNTIGSYTEMLIRDFDASVFTSETLHEVCSQWTWWPAYPALRHILAEWHKAHYPTQHVLTDPEHPRLTQTERFFVDQFIKDNTTLWQRKDEITPPPYAIQCHRRNQDLSLLRRYAPKAYVFLIQKNPSWQRVEETNDPDLIGNWHSEQGVQASITALQHCTDDLQKTKWIQILKAAIRRYAPQYVPLVEHAFPSDTHNKEIHS